ncbi:DoxX family protein [Emticicia sp. TH156]|uniref:DoxX family protein n=1 Tax=Emticicia sp. TH156 TaxID=2067454 RepID=UPI000C76EC34|nr:DoxX family protein [Emticicia sp. TH156]PLK44452.1 hypothetical protein C0V77_11755 [Emticicia sp. TH156]
MNNQNTSKIRNLAAWLCQILLSAGFLWAAYLKLFQPIDQLAQMWPWTGDNPTLTRVAGLVDLMGGLGIILPTALRIKPILTLYAAYGTILLMLAASAFHISRGESSQIGFNIFFAALAALVAWARR